MNKKRKIPKVIHYCWFGGAKKSKLIEKCIDSWKKYCPEYKIIEWNEKNFDINANEYVKEAYENKKWAFVTDFVRLYAVYNNGGIYLDTDIELIKPLDSLLENDNFFSIEYDNNINTGLGFGAVKNNKIVKILLESYNDISFKFTNGKLDLTPCTERNSKTLEIYFNTPLNNIIDNKINQVKILSAEYFCPFNSSTGVMKKTKNTYGIHWFNGSWRDSKLNTREKLLRPFKRLLGQNTFDKIKKIIKWK